MRRREFITLLGSTTMWPLAARAQNAARMARIGYLTLHPPGPDDAALTDGLLPAGLGLQLDHVNKLIVI
jgi:hypothetical protein